VCDVETAARVGDSLRGVCHATPTYAACVRSLRYDTKFVRRFLELAHVGGPGLVGFDRRNETLSPRHWGHRYEVDNKVMCAFFGHRAVRASGRLFCQCYLNDIVAPTCVWYSLVQCSVCASHTCVHITYALVAREGLETSLWRAYFGDYAHIVTVNDVHPYELSGVPRSRVTAAARAGCI
jgi:hypothetical protein